MKTTSKVKVDQSGIRFDQKKKTQLPYKYLPFFFYNLKLRTPFFLLYWHLGGLKFEFQLMKFLKDIFVFNRGATNKCVNQIWVCTLPLVEYR